jgi:hypothetical protein
MKTYKGGLLGTSGLLKYKVPGERCPTDNMEALCPGPTLPPMFSGTQNARVWVVYKEKRFILVHDSTGST